MTRAITARAPLWVPALSLAAWSTVTPFLMAYALDTSAWVGAATIAPAFLFLTGVMVYQRLTRDRRRAKSGRLWTHRGAQRKEVSQLPQSF